MCLWGTLIVGGALWDEALRMARTADPKAAFRAAWALEHAYVCAPEAVEERFDEFFRTWLATDSSSVQRIFSKMLCDMLRRRVVTLDDDRLADLVACCFDRLTAPSTPSAVAVWQIELLDGCAARVGWIGEQLEAIVRSMSERPDCLPSMASYARRFLRRRR